MFKFYPLQAKVYFMAIVGLIVIPLMSIMPGNVKASTLTTDLQALAVQANDVNTQLSAISLNTGNSCTELGKAITSVTALTTAITDLNSKLSAPLLVDTNSMAALDDLSLISLNIASVLPVLSADISTIKISSDMTDIQPALDAMLNLSDDIGTMANRILEMADKILLMADNIGSMADRILLTQQIQSSNMALTQAFILSSQENMIVLNPTVDTSVYNNPLSDIINSGNVLLLDINNTPLTETNMNTVIGSFENRIDEYRNSTMLIFNTVNTDSSYASHYINSDTLTMLCDLSIINTALSNSLNQYAQSVNKLAPDTNISVLNDTVYSMLRLASDIGVMGNRIVEMGNRIYVMADNIGLMSARIIDTQTLQQSNLALTQSNLNSAQITGVSVISAFGL
ncbi:MAG: hypothetical protein OEY89_05740 [Gammaproteobacteria bacterium]|nr:hypothetical protein [Gammaproteobacteria bacterium]